MLFRSAVTSPKRFYLLPDLPTVAESGVPGFDTQEMQGIVGPAGMPRDLLGKLNAEMVKILGSAELVQNLAAQGAEQGGGSPDEFAQFAPESGLHRLPSFTRCHTGPSTHE